MPRVAKLDRDAILQIASDYIDAEGLDALTLGELAKKLNIRTPSLYNYFNGLPELKMRLAEKGLNQLHQSMLQHVLGLSGDQAIKAMSHAYLHFARQHPGLYDASQRFPHMEDEPLQKARKQVVDLVLKVLEHYGFDTETSIHMVRGLRSILHGFASIEQQTGFRMPYSIEQSFSLLIDTYINGLHHMKP